MKAISLWQPWASLIGRGKSVETRSWPTDYRGPIAIQAAKRFTADEVNQCMEEPFFSALADFAQHTPDGVFTRFQLPLGAIVATATLQSCMSTGYNATACWVKEEVNPIERAFGNYSIGRYGWLFTNIRILPEPIPYRGAQGFFNVPDELLGLQAEAVHTCHARGCQTPVPPKMLMCSRHWRMVPRVLQARVWHHYRPGQEIDKNPTREYLTVMMEAVNAVARAEGLAEDPWEVQS